MKNEEKYLAKDIPKPLAFGIAGITVVIVCGLGYYLTNRNTVPPAPPMIMGTTMPQEVKDQMSKMPGGAGGMPPDMPGMRPGMPGMPGMPGGGPPAMSGSVGGGPSGSPIPSGRPAHQPDKPGDVPPPPSGAPEGMVGHRVDPSTLKIPGH